jgi:hypothetical protein
MNKTCTNCQVNKDISEFRKHSVNLGYQSWCKPCVNVAASLANKHRRWENCDRINSIKFERGCIDCGTREHLEFDHKDPTAKTDNVSRLRNQNWSNIQAEIDKCEVRCRTCHIAKTTAKQEWNHGGRR